MSRITSFTSLAVLALTFAFASGCAHAVRIDSAPGADIYVDGQHIGTAPATYNETSGMGGTVQITAKKNGQETTVVVDKSNVDLGAVGAGTAGGLGICCGVSMVATVLAFMLPPCGMLAVVGWGAAAAGPLAGWLWFGKKLPDNVSVPLPEAAYSHSTVVDERRPTTTNF